MKTQLFSQRRFSRTIPEPALEPPDEEFEDRIARITDEEDAQAQRTDLEYCDGEAMINRTLPDENEPLFGWFCDYSRKHAAMMNGHY
jgi:hypothetical protein